MRQERDSRAFRRHALHVPFELAGLDRAPRVQFETMTPTQSVPRTDAAHILALTTLAVGQPLLYVLGRNGEFFVASRTRPSELLALVALVVVGVPAVLILIELLAGRFGPRARRTVHMALVALLVTAVTLPMINQGWAAPATYVVAAAAALGIIGAVAYARLALVRLATSLLAVMPLVVAANFLFNSDARQILFHSAPRAARPTAIRSKTPVMLVIFDELPLSSLLDRSFSIDKGRYPNFARLAETAHWFRNARSVSDNTVLAVPAILTGRQPQPNLLPTAAQQPDNLFTMLGGSYRIEAQEPVTRLCPAALCREPVSRRGSLATFWSDVAIVYGHTVLPRGLSSRFLPPIDSGWRDFGNNRSGTPANDGWVANPNDWDWYKQGYEHAVRVRSNPRTLYALHYLLPHAPWRYLPDGHQYPARDIPGIGPNEHWTSNQVAVDEAYQRHLLQVGYVDRVLGTLIDKLERAGVYDNAMVIVTADHGCGFEPDEDRRLLNSRNWSDVLRVPLLVKTPGQKVGVVDDRPVETIDVLPTIADVLGIQLPFAVDGRSLLRPRDQDRPRRMAMNEPGQFKPPADLSGLGRSVRRKVALFGDGADTRRLFGRGRFWELVGRPVDQLQVSRSDAIQAVLAESERFADVNPDEPILPVLVSGGLSGAATIGKHPSAAVAVNGVVRAVTPLEVHPDGVTFRTLVPAESLKRGPNEVKILLIEEDGKASRITSAQQQGGQYTLEKSAPDWELRSADSSAPVRHVAIGSVLGSHAVATNVTRHRRSRRPLFPASTPPRLLRAIRAE